MATVPQRELRNNTAELLRRVERGERLTITVHGHPVADLVPREQRRRFVPLDEIARDLRGLLSPDDRLDEEMSGLLAGSVDDPFERYEELDRDRRDAGPA
jgi:prevent-host-death family protein